MDVEKILQLNENKQKLIHFRKRTFSGILRTYLPPSEDLRVLSNNIRDLGVIVNNLTWSVHINKMFDVASGMLSWIFRTFQSRDLATIILFFSMFARSHFKYCRHLWSLSTQNKIKWGLKRCRYQSHAHTNKWINSMTILDYWVHFKTLKLCSLQCHHERYSIYTIWKICN